jgi:hypothetical protein
MRQRLDNVAVRENFDASKVKPLPKRHSRA